MVRSTNAAVIAFYESLGYEDGEVVVLGKFLDKKVRRQPMIIFAVAGLLPARHRVAVVTPIRCGGESDSRRGGATSGMRGCCRCQRRSNIDPLTPGAS